MNLAGREVGRAAVLGYARTGRALADFLLTRGVEVLVSEAGRLSDDDRRMLSSRGADVEQGGHTARVLQTDLILPSPGVPADLPVLEEAAKLGIPVVSELDLASALCPELPILAITGTNGKSSTVLFLAALLRRAGHRPLVAGNIGVPLIAVVDQAAGYDVLVVEVSSFQLEQSRSFHPRVGVLLNLTPDHLERHHTLAGYAAAKARLFALQTPGDAAILPSSLLPSFPGIRARVILFDREAPPATPAFAALPPHQQVNLAAAVCACRAFCPKFDAARIEPADLEEALALPYRLQDEGSLDGMHVVNDSKSTNAASSIVALDSFPGPILLLLGGRHKHAGYEELAEAIRTRDVKRVFVYGEATAFLVATLTAAGIERFEIWPDLPAAFAAARRAGAPGDTLLFSPGCSSYDQFDSFMHRGEVFSGLVRRARSA